MIEQLENIKDRYYEIRDLMAQPDAISDMNKYSSLAKEYKDLEDIVNKYDEYNTVINNIKSAEEVLETEKDEEMREMAKEELEDLNPKRDSLEKELKEMLIPKDPNDDKNAILEIRAGAGGDEANIFAGDLFRMYQKLIEKKGWKLDILDYTEGNSGGYKEIIGNVSGNDVYGELKFEAGVHRVQRVPETETQGRVHTSAATVAVLPEMEEVDVEIDMNEVRKDVFCASGPGGQSVNTTYSAVRLTHEPTGIVVQCQDEKSQIKNLDKAMKVLRSRIYEKELEKHNQEVSEQRRSMVGSGDRSNKIRTYNFPQSRVTDHRINYSVHNLDEIMSGGVDEFIEQLRIAENAEKMKETES